MIRKIIKCIFIPLLLIISVKKISEGRIPHDELMLIAMFFLFYNGKK